MVPQPMLVPAPTVASPRYVRWFALAPLPSFVFFSSTKLPTWAPSPTSAPGRSRENGPTTAALPTTASSKTQYGFTTAPSATVVSVRMEPCPTRQPAPMRVAPRSRTPGSRMVSGPTCTPSSQSKRSGSSIITPAFMSSWPMRRVSARAASESSSWSFTPAASTGETRAAAAPGPSAASATRSVR